MDNPTTRKSKGSGQSGKIEPQKDSKGRAQTKRGQRINDLLKDHQQQESLEKNPAYLDAMVRKQLGDLVRLQIETNNLEELEAVLKEHQRFIADIIDLINKKKRKK